MNEYAFVCMCVCVRVWGGIFELISRDELLQQVSFWMQFQVGFVKLHRQMNLLSNLLLTFSVLQTSH